MVGKLLQLQKKTHFVSTGQIMGVLRSLIFLLSFQLLHMAKGSMVWLNESGYEDLVVAINPSVPEDANIILNTMTMIKDASNYLFEATKHRFFFKSVKIILPKTWKKNSTYSRLKTESYNKADIIIADPYLKYGDDPYTLQYGGCAMKGRYIHFTPNFLLDSSLLKVYGDRGRVFVHEWAHLRWGVFDEYNYNAPFYVSENARVEATRYHISFFCFYIALFQRFKKCFQYSCNVKNSIMYMQYLPSVVEFCDKNTHNYEAPNMQNKMCNYKSTWEVIMESDDFRNSSVVTGLAPPFETTFQLLQTQDRAVSLVLDVSGSMLSYNRITNLRTAAEVFLIQIIEVGSRVGIVTFESTAYEKSPLIQITSIATRQRLVQNLPTTAGGGTNICAGIEKGLQVKYIVLLQKRATKMIRGLEHLSFSRESGAIIHTIALGPLAARELEEFSNITGGLQLYAVDVDVPSKLVEAFSEITTGSGDISEQSIQLESKDQEVNSLGWINNSVTIDKTVGNDTFFVFSWSRTQPFFFVRDPKGKEYGSSDFTVDSSNLKTARLSINGTAEVGDWHYYIQNVDTIVQTLSVTVTSRAASSDVSPVILQAYMERTNTAPYPVVVYAEVSQNFLPVLGATVIATIEKDNAAAVTLPLFDSGTGADMTKNDGIYSGYFTSVSGDGRYSLKVSAQGRNQTVRLGRRQNRALYVPGYIENGKIQMNAPRPELADEEILANLESFSRTSTSSIKLDNTGSLLQGLPPCKITDLDAYIENETIVLTWTAPGGDLDSGKADHYIIKSGADLLSLRDEFDNATSVDSFHLIPQEAGSTETLKFKPENLIIENGTIIYIAMRAVDDTNLTSDTSNIAKATWFIPPKVSVPTDDEDNTSDGVGDGINITLIVAVVAGCVVLVCIIVSSTVCILQNQKKRRDPAIRM
uniref:Chloride channel accessory 1 n=1 Tax=Phasianus colchicus TaxID=9054 RepID=A0A669QZ95_PHACC